SCLEFAAQLQEACGLAWGANGQLGQSRPPTEIARPATEVASPSGPPGPPGAGLPFPGPPTSGPGGGAAGRRADPAAPTSAPGPGQWGQAPAHQPGWDTPPQDPRGWPAQPPAADAGWLPGLGQAGGQSAGQGTRPGGYQQPPRRRGALIAGLVVLFVAAAAVTAFLLTRGHGSTPVAKDGPTTPATSSQSSSPPSTPTTTPSSPAPPAVLGPAATVQA